VTPRRWLAWCNPKLAHLITETLGTDAWINETTLLAGLRKYADDKAFQAKWRAVKHANKERLSAKIKVVRSCHLSFAHGLVLAYPYSLFPLTFQRVKHRIMLKASAETLVGSCAGPDWGGAANGPPL
jgi:glucan phosphorylase